MGADNVRFQIADREKFSSVVQGDFRMGKAVKPRVRVRLVPVIEKQVVEQAAPGRCIAVQPQEPANHIADKSHHQTVFQSGNVPVLGKLLHAAHTGGVH